MTKQNSLFIVLQNKPHCRKVILMFPFLSIIDFPEILLHAFDALFWIPLQSYCIAGDVCRLMAKSGAFKVIANLSEDFLSMLLLNWI